MGSHLDSETEEPANEPIANPTISAMVMVHEARFDCVVGMCELSCELPAAASHLLSLNRARSLFTTAAYEGRLWVKLARSPVPDSALGEFFSLRQGVKHAPT